MVVVGIASAITSIESWHPEVLSGRHVELGSSAPNKSSKSSVAVRPTGVHNCTKQRRAAPLEMVPQAVGRSPFCSFPSPPLGRLGVSGSRVPKEAPCIVRRSSSEITLRKISVEQKWQGGKNGKRIWLPQSNSPLASSSSSVSEEASEAIDPGLLTRVAKLYRPAVILPGLGNNSSDYDVLVRSLESMEVACTVVKVARIDWLRNAAGLLDGDYWKGKLRPRPVLNWYLDRMKAAIQTAKAGAAEGQKVSLIGHSAGGWLARVYMAEFGTDDIAMLLTLGTPHLPPPRGVPGVFDQTRGLLYHIEENCPGAYHAPSVKYVCVAGRYVKGGGKLVEDQSAPVVTGAGTFDMDEVASMDNNIEGDLVKAVSDNNNSRAEKLVDDVVLAEAQPKAVTAARPTFRDRIVGAGYKQVCGRAEVWGDGVVPEESAYLEGAVNISLDGVYHSPVGANDVERPWYGSSGKIDLWVQHLLE